MIRLEKNNTELHFDKYVHRGSMMYLRSALPLSDPDQLYNYIKSSSALKDAGLTPEDFNIFHPVAEQFRNKNKEELISVITELMLKIEDMERPF